MRDYIEGDYRITEYENGTVVKQLISQEPAISELEPTDPQPSIDEIIRANYLETQYQTVLMEMQSGM